MLYIGDFEEILDHFPELKEEKNGKKNEENKFLEIYLSIMENEKKNDE